jgi:hypothetical protein
MSDFPPSAPVSVTKTIPSYLYVQYNDDDNLQAFVTGYNGMSQTYVDWFNSANLPIYTKLTGGLLDWIAQGLYGISRPTLSTQAVIDTGPLNTFVVNTLALDGGVPGSGAVYLLASDDVFQRIITWHFYKGDGKVFSIPWLKRRVLRFLYGVNGTDTDVADTSGVSVSISSFNVTIDISDITNVTTAILTAFQEAVANSVLELPPQFVFTVTT